MKFEIYERLNTGSISLNAQELRNSIYRGSFNKLLHELTKVEQFRGIIGTKTPRKRMVDEEAILRFFAMRAKIANYRTPLKKFLNEYMAATRNSSEEQIAEFRSIFEQTIARVQRTLGGSAFRMLTPNGQPSETAVNRALLESQLIAFSWLDQNSQPNADAVRRTVGALFNQPVFVDAI